MLDRDSLRRVTEDVIRAEHAAMPTRARVKLPAGPWPDDMAVDQDGLGFDSLDLLTIAGAVNATFHIHETGIEDLLLVRRHFGAWIDLITRAREMAGQRISFHTSGSTDGRKRCIHAIEKLVAEADAHAARLKPARILTAVPCNHIYGFIFTVLLPLRAGVPIIDIRTRLPSRFQPNDVIVSFPEHWRFIARSVASLAPAAGVSSAAPMPAELAAQLQDLGLTRLTEVYGSSETAGIGWRDDPAAPFTLLETLSLKEEHDEVWLHGRDGTRVAVPDRIAMADANRFHILGRLDGAVQVGGINVFPNQVAAALEQHPQVARAQVRLVGLSGGSRLKALIVPKDSSSDPECLRQALEVWSISHLPVAQRPRSFTIVADMPSGAMGKNADWAEAV
jgi:4-coumarate--CoA ligase